MSQLTANAGSFQKFRKKLEGLYYDTDEVAKRVVNQMANVGLAETKRNTPVGKYKKYVSFVTKDGQEVNFKRSVVPIGGTLRKNWRKISAYKRGNEFCAGYSNNTDYGLYVNNGHRVVNKDGATVGYVKGVRMLEQGMNKARRQTGAIFNQEIARLKKKGGW